MADSKRQLVCTALDTRLKTILTASGYNTNLGLQVHEWRETPLDLSDLPACIWRDRSEDDGNATIGGTIGYQIHQLKMELSVFISGSTTPSQARQILADIQTAIGVDQTFGGLADRTDPLSNELEIAHEENEVGRLTVNITITYRTKKWNAYT